MAMVYVTIKIMPTEVAKLEEIKNTAFAVVKNFGGNIAETKEEDIAFGLKAIIIRFSIRENVGMEALETEIENINGVSSLEVIDVRRAIG